MAEYIKARKLISRFSEDPFFGLRYNINLYRGCQHSCIYCDSRSECYKLGDLSRIRIKENAIDLLSDELSRIGEKGTIGTGSMNDPYMPAEKDMMLTSAALDVIGHYRFPVHIITKSDLVVRDIEKIRRIGRVYSAVSVTVTTADDKLASYLEPDAPPPSRRFEAVRKLSDAGIYTGILITPVLPFITDSVRGIEEILVNAGKSGAKYVLFFPAVTLRDRQREYYYSGLDKHFPGMRERYEKTFRDSYSCFPPDHRILSSFFYKKAGEMGIDTGMKFYRNPASSQLDLFQ